MHAIMMASPSRVARNLTFAAALLGLLMAQLDGAVVIAALPTIQHELHGAGVAGVTAVYGLAVTVATPMHGRLGDMFGRRLMFPLAIAVFAIGSIGCAVAPGLAWLIVARAVQGLGGSGLIVGAVSVLTELFDREVLLRRQGWLTAVSAVAFVAGPPVGGVIAGQLGWRWIFGLNLPICLVALVIGFAGLPGRDTGLPRGRFDVPGALLVTLGGASLVTLGSGENLGWWSLPLVLVAVVAAVTLVRVERRSQSPLVSPRLFQISALARTITTTGLSGATLFGTFTFMSLAIVATTGGGPTETGLLLVAMTAGQLVPTVFFSVLAKKFPNLPLWGRAALAAGVAGMALVALAILLPSVALLVCGLVLSGAALGLSMQVYTLITQSSAPKDAIGAAVATLTFSRQIGNVVGIAVFGWILALLPSGGLVAIFALAAAVTLVALLAAPSSADRADAAAA
ncbi:MFS transporter [Fodinicola acaciae]|uniref:MFS transporter n=1 Tax=Fodinicola acaciae TaxID=2681555 RepID=UPI001C9E9E29|nr:MFS transporter [Fodinicola acaciae]